MLFLCFILNVSQIKNTTLFLKYFRSVRHRLQWSLVGPNKNQNIKYYSGSSRSKRERKKNILEKDDYSDFLRMNIALNKNIKKAFQMWFA